MKLNKILRGIDIKQISGDPEQEILSVCFDSRSVVKDSLFVAIRGGSFDGHDFIEKAIEAGAKAVICETIPSSPLNATILQVENSHFALGIAASNFFGNPSEKIRVVGVTGTNGKTTTATLLYRLFTNMGYKCGLLSTIRYYVAGSESEATHTTPDPLIIQMLLSRMVERGCEYCFMEVSSHSLDQMRVAGLNFTGAIFSNLTHDHLDYHKSFLEYLKAKKRLFDMLPEKAFALTNADDKNGDVMVQNCHASVYRYSCHSPADFNCKVIEKSTDGMLLKIDGSEVWTRFIGEHNAYNLLAVYAAARLLGAEREELLTGISSLTSVSGRLEYMSGPNSVTAVVDYAHTPDALENVLKTLTDISRGREIVTVFGCGGNRDTSKRPEMAEVAAKYSHRVVVTSDNPRFEDPEKIIEDIRSGFKQGDMAKTLFITDRQEAIRCAITTAKKGSMVLVAGKGHENYQEVMGVKHHFDDKEVISEVFNQLRNNDAV
ncbi:MAG: UDP-N-acetylmuramoyl-L-alanyl-D-glutamate--2,6-diaminopimelate ligase [Bacteroidales bacterium]|nr:UDP-N-acetylmuramoyl-L-alanyl-D-glutamate--2,6-diaminopimelate ligase [Bacteroidales bacterium]MDD2424571.1 UDP-N-acetylmuramoyl-L-alanyl-D-glutamate--2,6-diaminopimelate ligase [Bacteroidales bacterium]MDD3988755.1 UDP-N-acetylmuramoyl-L-alanyl-D-glutamate--2,6-diaminopimelate ligase [Bacteroidales bacterium]MDD4639616.1 UDP-N-acetylmuramoyl-L-alanyl-D-glutamate--2,6-diaminopimelate ligase [Bacteroidales bacterium]